MDLAEQLADHMDAVRGFSTTPVKTFAELLAWGEKAIKRMGPASVSEVQEVCKHWWDGRAPAKHGFLRDAWFELSVSIESLLRATAEKCVAKPFDGGVMT